MSSLKVSHRLLLGSLLLVVLLAGVVWLLTATGTWQANRMAELRTAAVEAPEHAAGMAISARNAHSAVQSLLAARATESANGVSEGAPVSPQAARAAIEGAFGTFERHLALSREATAFEGRGATERLSAITSAYNSYRQAVNRFIDPGSTGDEAAANYAAFFESQIGPHFEDTFAPLLSRHITATQAALTERFDAADAARRWSGRFALGALILLLITSIVLGVLNAGYVDRGLRRSVSAARSIAAGRMASPVRIPSDDEFGDLAEALNDMVSRLSTATLSKTYVENIVQSMADPLVVVDPDVRISMVNQALLDLLGYEADELSGASVTRIFAHTGRQRGAAIKQDIERGLAGNVESHFRTKAGQEVAISLSSALVRAGGEVQGLVIVAKDITEQKRREKELIDARDSAERMVQLRDAFLANMSHEIRTPLTGILGSAQVLAEVVEGEHRNLARIIEDAGNRLLDTINSVLEMARIEAGEVQPEMEILDFAEEAEAVANVLRPVAEKKGLALKVYPPVSGRVAAQIDRSCLNRILNNLVGNAIKFTRDGAVSIEVSADEYDAILTVRDTGIGIAKEFIPYLFDDFKQESTGLQRSHEGSGLGLAITKKLIDMMGGTVEVESVKGLGSSFTVRFERVPLEEAAIAMEREQFQPVAASAYMSDIETLDDLTPTFEAPPPAAERTRRDLLLIEDNEQNAYMARFMLDGFAADVATTPGEAIALARRNQYSVLLVDINLGTDSSGIDLLRDFRALEGYEKTPALAVTAYALPGDRERFLNEGFDDYVSKPYRKETLRAAVEKAMASIAALTPVADLDEVLGGSFDDAAEAPDEASFSEPAPRPAEVEEAPPAPVAAAVPAPPAAPAPPPPAPDFETIHSAIANSEPPALRAPQAEPPSAPVGPLDAAPTEPVEFVPPPPPQPAAPVAGPAGDYPTASPDEFLPSSYMPGRTAFPPEVARLVEEAAQERDAKMRREREAFLARSAGHASGHASQLNHPHDDSSYDSHDPHGLAGDGAGRPPAPPRG